MAEHVPGVAVPDAVIARIAAAADQKCRRPNARCIETIHALQRLEGVAGVHLMGHRNEPRWRVIIEAGLRPAACDRAGAGLSATVPLPISNRLNAEPPPATTGDSRWPNPPSNGPMRSASWSNGWPT
jgi:hypothetical protein